MWIFPESKKNSVENEMKIRGDPPKRCELCKNLRAVDVPYDEMVKAINMLKTDRNTSNLCGDSHFSEKPRSFSSAEGGEKYPDEINAGKKIRHYGFEAWNKLMGEEFLDEDRLGMFICWHCGMKYVEILKLVDLGS